MNGKLYVVATPIGNLSDISARAIKVMSDVKYFAAEDTRETHGLLNKLGIPSQKNYITNNGYNENNVKDKLLEILTSGNDVVLVSDAGTPGVSDPGAILVDAAAREGITVVGVCGASAVITAISVSGFVKSNSSFAFLGFLPRKSGEIKEKFNFALSTGVGTVVFYESPLRIIDTFEILASQLPMARVCLCNDLTKLYERIYRGSPSEVLEELKGNPKAQKGEYAIVLDLTDIPAESNDENTSLSAEALIVQYMTVNNCNAKTAIAAMDKKCGFTKNQLKAASINLKTLFSE